MKVKRALISVSCKDNLDFFVRELEKLDIEIVSTGGTKKYIDSLGIKSIDISEFTGFPEILDGRVKTLHPKVHGAILSKRDNFSHIEENKKHNISYIDMVVVNFYPFDTLLKDSFLTEKEASLDEMIENIDIGGPSMLRSSAKNYKDVIPICDPNDYHSIIDDLKINGDITKEKRLFLAYKVFSKTSIYDNLISLYLENKLKKEENFLKNSMNLNLEKKLSLRYGENPHQMAGFYINTLENELPWIQYGGKELSYNNLLDIEASYNLVNDITSSAICIIKHNNPCGVGVDENLVSAYQKALMTDRESAFGGIVGINRKVEKPLAEEIIKIFTECVVAPGYTNEAIEVLKNKKNLRILEIKPINKKNFLNNNLEYKKIFNGFLVQESDKFFSKKRECKTFKNPNSNQIKDLELAWIICKAVKSNAIVLVKDGILLGIGAGQMSRVDSVKIAIKKAIKAGFDLENASLASDAFFPFKDSIELLNQYKISAIIQPGGSVRDAEVIDACNSFNIGMIFTGERHFRH